MDVLHAAMVFEWALTLHTRRAFYGFAQNELVLVVPLMRLYMISRAKNRHGFDLKRRRHVHRTTVVGDEDVQLSDLLNQLLNTHAARAIGHMGDAMGGEHLLDVLRDVGLFGAA